MLKQITIQNLILIENASAEFKSGLTIITGETGSGKSAILQGIRWLIGERAEASMVRYGAEKGIVEAVFEIEGTELPHLLQESGFDLDGETELIIRREMTSHGKGRIYINHQIAQLSFLRIIGSHLVHMVSQHANQELFSVDYHGRIIDIYGELDAMILKYKDSYDRTKHLQETIDRLIQEETDRARQMQICEMELDELQAANCLEGEENELFSEYSLLVHAEEMSTTIAEINQIFSGERESFFSQLHRCKQLIHSIENYDPQLTLIAQSFQNTYIELQDIAHSMEAYQDKCHSDPQRLETINQRLIVLNRLKKKYGPKIEDVITYRRKTEEKLLELQNRDAEIDSKQSLLRECESDTSAIAAELTLQRKKYAKQLETVLTHILQTLNMPYAEFSIGWTPCKRSRDGEDHFEFFFSPNRGEQRISLREKASGGEISRILLAIQVILAGKQKVKTLIFDEIDANIGGQTATIIGNKLKEISQQHQVICITHFPQVAMQGDHHFQVVKEEREGRTFTCMYELFGDQCRTDELARMSGN